MAAWLSYVPSKGFVSFFVPPLVPFLVESGFYDGSPFSLDISSFQLDPSLIALGWGSAGLDRAAFACL